ncbi:MAG: hypothetical protein U0074_14480 [Kouleothrix sp.]
MLVPFAAGFLRAPRSDRVKYALFRARAGAMAAAYTEVFAALARRYRITIVAGSILLPAPHIRAGRVDLATAARSKISRRCYPMALPTTSWPGNIFAIHCVTRVRST